MSPSDTLRVGAMNVQALSLRKLSDPAVQPHLLEIIKRHDLILLQEVRDPNGAMMTALVKLLAGESVSLPTYKPRPKKSAAAASSSKAAEGVEEEVDSDSDTLEIPPPPPPVNVGGGGGGGGGKEKKTRKKKGDASRAIGADEEGEENFIYEGDDYPWHAIASPCIGRTSHKERYLYLYRSNLFKVLAAQVYNDQARDEFEREPFAVRFRLLKASGKQDLILVGLHTQPTKAREELALSAQVIQGLKKQWADTPRGSGRYWRALITSALPISCLLPPGKIVIGPILMGDFNAGKNYVPLKDRPSNPLFSAQDLVWGIGDDVKTAVNENTKQAYDRMVWYSKDQTWLDHVGVWEYGSELGLDLESCLRISDHWPIKVEVKLQ